MYKIALIVGTRPEIIKLSETIKLMDIFFNLVLIHTGQNYDYELNKIFFEDLEIREPDYYLDAIGRNLGETLGNIISKSYNLLLELRPDALLVLGDTNSCLSVLSAKRLRIPVFHIEAGNRCYDENLPEEINRRLIDHISDVNLCYSNNAERNLLREGLSSEYTFNIGSPIKEIYAITKDRIDKSKILLRLCLERKNYFVVSIHREENVDDTIKFLCLIESINKIAKDYKKPVVFSVHPRTKKKIEELKIDFPDVVVLIKPLGFTDYINLQKNAYCVLSDSGTLAEESAIIGFPAVSIRNSTERAEAFENGSITLGHSTYETIDNAISLQVYSYMNTGIKNVEDYNDLNFSMKVANIIMSYIPVINKKIWRKDNE